MTSWQRIRFRSAARRPGSPELVRRFEDRIGATLPEEYRRFILAVNGGRPVNWQGEMEEAYAVVGIDWNGREASAGGSKAIVDYLYVAEDWKGVMEESRMDVLTLDGAYRSALREHQRVAPGHIPIGKDPGGSQFLLGIGGAERGAVYFWSRSYFDPDRWASDPMHNIGFVAKDFDAFIDSISFED